MPRKETKKEDMFVGVQQPDELRKNILLAAKQAIFFLKKYENLKELNSRKEKEIEKLKVTMSQLNNLNVKLKSFFPRDKIKTFPHMKTSKEKKEGKLEKKKEPKKERLKPGIQRLESDLSKIESKLANL